MRKKIRRLICEKSDARAGDSYFLSHLPSIREREREGGGEEAYLAPFLFLGLNRNELRKRKSVKSSFFSDMCQFFSPFVFSFLPSCERREISPTLQEKYTIRRVETKFCQIFVPHIHGQRVECLERGKESGILHRKDAVGFFSFVTNIYIYLLGGCAFRRLARNMSFQITITFFLLYFFLSLVQGNNIYIQRTLLGVFVHNSARFLVKIRYTAPKNIPNWRVIAYRSTPTIDNARGLPLVIFFFSPVCICTCYFHVTFI